MNQLYFKAFPLRFLRIYFKLTDAIKVKLGLGKTDILRTTDVHKLFFIILAILSDNNLILIDIRQLNI